MMHQVVEEHLPIGQKARPVEDGLALKLSFQFSFQALSGVLLRAARTLAAPSSRRRPVAPADSKGMGL